jgi:UDP-N-acetylmuramate dehydrogenase
VLVNRGGASGQEIFDLSTKILEDIHEKFGIELEREVNVV